MDKYSESSRTTLENAMNSLIEAVKKVAADEKQSFKNVMLNANTELSLHLLKTERATNVFNLFCSLFKHEYEQKKEELKNEFPDLTFVQIAAKKFALLTLEEKSNLEVEAAALKTSYDIRNEQRAILKIKSIRRYAERAFNTSTLLLAFRQKTGGGTSFYNGTAFGDPARKILEYLHSTTKGRELLQKPSKRKVYKPSAGSLEFRKSKKKVAERLSDLYNRQLGISESKIYFKQMLSTENDVQCLGWPALVPFKTVLDMKKSSLQHLVRALDRNEVRFAYKTVLSKEDMVQTVAGKNAAAATAAAAPTTTSAAVSASVPARALASAPAPAPAPASALSLVLAPSLPLPSSGSSLSASSVRDSEDASALLEDVLMADP